MDELTADERRASVRFVPDRRATVLCGVGAVIAVGLVIAVGDAPGRLLLGLAALLLAGLTASDLVFRPRLTVDAQGLRVCAPTARAALNWDEVDEVRADVHTRRGLRTVTLEIDANETLIVLTRRALGATPESVVAVVRAFDPR